MSLHHNRYDDRTVADIIADEMWWEEWLATPEAEQERQVSKALKRYSSSLQNLTPTERYCRSRRAALRHCLSWRQLYNDDGLDFFKEMLRERQARLVELRHRHAISNLKR
jgi:hypothetical protein